MKKLVLFAMILIATVVSAHGNHHTPVTICHKGHPITVDDDAVPAHLAHGDWIVDAQHPCPPVDPTSVPTEEPTVVPTTEEPTQEPTSVPTEVEPTQVPTEIVPTFQPTEETRVPQSTVVPTIETFRALPVCEAWSVIGTEFSWEVFLNGAWQLITSPDGSAIVTPVEYEDRWNDVIGAVEHVAFTRLVITSAMPEDATLYRTTTQSERWVECHDGVHSVDQR